MEWLVAIVVGGLIGWIASLLMKTNARMGILANVLVGIFGSALGFWIAGVLGIVPVDGLLRFVVALGGATLLIFLLQLLGAFGGRRI